jgi:hypothetical protein
MYSGVMTGSYLEDVDEEEAEDTGIRPRPLRVSDSGTMTTRTTSGKNNASEM